MQSFRAEKYTHILFKLTLSRVSAITVPPQVNTPQYDPYFYVIVTQHLQQLSLLTKFPQIDILSQNLLLGDG